MTGFYFKCTLTYHAAGKLQIRYFYKVKKQLLLFLFIVIATVAKAQKVDSIFVNLYTDSLKKGTYNYINVDGLLSNGRYLPLDSSHIVFSSNHGRFFGNSLWLDKNFTEKKVHIIVSLRSNPATRQEFDMYIKRMEDGELKTAEQLLQEWRKKGN